MDIRTFGKEYEKYYNRAKDEHGVRFIQSRIHAIKPAQDSDDLIILYSDQSGTLYEEVFDMVVLSVGFEMSRENIDLEIGRAHV